MFIPQNMSYVTCHMSHVTCHMSRVTCHLSPVGIFFLIFRNFFFVIFFGISGGASWWRVCYQRGLPRLVYSCSLEQAKSATNSQSPHVWTRPLKHIFKSKTFERINIILTQTWVFLVNFFSDLVQKMFFFFSYFFKRVKTILLISVPPSPPTSQYFRTFLYHNKGTNCNELNDFHHNKRILSTNWYFLNINISSQMNWL